jgi:hypothetical protein
MAVDESLVDLKRIDLKKIISCNTELVNYLQEMLDMAKQGAIWEGIILVKGKDGNWYHRTTEIEKLAELLGSLELIKNFALRGAYNGKD